MHDEFLDLQTVDPVAGRLKALQAAQTSTDSIQLAFAHRTLAVGCRDTGDVDGARSHLRLAMMHARRGADDSVRADILATRGGTHIILGNPRAGMRDLSVASRAASGELLGKILFRRGLSHYILGNISAAAEDGRAALEILQVHDEPAWTARALTLLGECATRLGRLNEAETYFEARRHLLDESSGYEELRLRMMEAWLFFLKGDVPQALAKFSTDELPLIVDGRLRGEATIRIATVYLAAGLVSEALEVLHALDPEEIPATFAAERRALLARAALASGLAGDARSMGLAASTDLGRMGMSLESAEAALVAVEAEARIAPSLDLLVETEGIVSSLRQANSRQIVDAWVLVGTLASAYGRRGRASDAFAAGGEYRRHSDLLVAASGWLARAKELEMRGASGVLRACARGLDVLDEYREIIGSSEMRASITARGDDLAKLAVRYAAHEPRALLRWSERWRATALAEAPVTPHGELSTAVARLRDIGRRMADAREAGESTEALERERRSLERKVRAEHHRQRAEGRTGSERFDPAELVAHVGDAALVELVNVDGTLHVLIVSGGRVRRVVAGDVRASLDLAEAGRSALRRAARTHRFAPGDLGQRFQDTVLGNAVRMLPDGPITIAPTAALHGAPFALMPALVNRPFSLVPSAAQWMRARDVAKPRAARRALVAGPGLLTGGAEVLRLATKYPNATVLRDERATVEATMKAIDGAKLAHLATHGTFRADSPLFSALEMADGPLSVYELERLKRAPYRTILSACESGVLAPVGAQEVLGLASALFSLGSAGLVCSIAEVNDEVTADLMMQIHASLDAKRTPAEALADVRATAGPIELATAAAFVALGV